MDSLYANLKFLASLIPATRTASANGSAVDTLGYNDAVVMINAGDIDTASGDETYAFKVQESDDGSTGWADITGATASVTADNDVKLIAVKNLNTGRKRYLRVVATLGGTTPSWPGSAMVVLGEPFSAPVN